MRVTVVGRTYLVRANQAKWNYLSNEVELTLLTPSQIRHALRVYEVEISNQWPHITIPGFMTERLSGFGFSPLPLWRTLRQAQPDLVQVDEEPSSLALLQVLLLKRLLGYRVIFFTWENIVTQFPGLFGLFHRLSLRLADGAIAGNKAAKTLLQSKGFHRPITIIPQLGVDTERFAPQSGVQVRQALGLTHFTVGYLGRLVSEKGLNILLQALAELEGEWQLLVVGRGPQRQEMEQQVQDLGISSRCCWVDTVTHDEVANYLNAMNALVLPSLSTPRWQEQFGHVLIEAMACGIPVIGSNSGAIPEVIGNVGFIFPEGQINTLTQQIRCLRDDPALCQQLGQRGRERVLSDYTHQRIAERTLAFWREVQACK